MTVAATLKRIVRRLRPPARPERYQPDYDPQRLIGAVRWDLVRKVVPPAAAESLPDDAPARIDQLVRHFATRRTPKFLYDCDALLASASVRSGEAHRWIEAAGKASEAMTTHGLPVYGRLAPPLRPGFAWEGEWCRDCRDVLFEVRPHRFAFAPRLALAVLDGRYDAQAFEALLRDWMAFAVSKPRLPFISNLVATQRLLAATCAFRYLAPFGLRDEHAFSVLRLLLQIIATDIDFLTPRVGTSYPNNHLLVDRFAGWFMAATYPELAGSKLHVAQSEREWLAELERQTYDDGGSFEHAVHYHGLAAEAAAAYLLLKRANGETLSPHHAARIEAILRFQADLAGPDGNVCDVGDATEDPLFPLDGGAGVSAAALREVYRRLFAPERAPLVPTHPERERAFWLTASQDTVAPANGDAVRARIAAYAQSGFYVLFEDDEATRCILRTGPAPGTSTMAGHMHSDLMSIHLVCEGQPIIVDAGTFSYRFGARQPDHPGRDVLASRPSSSGERVCPQAPLRNWRQYLTGPRAHSGIVLADVDPLGSLSGDFRSGSAHAQARCEHALAGEHLGFVHATLTGPRSHAGLGRAVIHVRGEYFVIVNFGRVIVPPGEVVYPLQFDHRVRLSEEDAHGVGIGADRWKGSVRLVASTDLHRAAAWPASGEPVQGWVSPGYGELEPAPQLLFRASNESAASALLFCFNNEHAVASVTAHVVEPGVITLTVTGPGFVDDLVVNTGSLERVHAPSAIEFEGRLLWLRSRADLVELRALHMKQMSAPGHGVELRFDEAQAEWNGRYRPGCRIC